MADFFSSEAGNPPADFSAAPAFGGAGGQQEGFGDFGGGGVVAATGSDSQPQEAVFGWGEPPASTSAPEFDGFAAPAQTPTFFSPTDVPAAAAAPLPLLSSGEAFSFEAPTTSAHLSGNTIPFAQPESPVAATAASPASPSAASSNSSYLSGGLAAQSPSPYLSGTAPVHETSDFIRQYEEQLERRREEQAHKEAQAKEQAESRAREELARFYEERRKKADASRRAHRESISSTEDRIPDSDAAAWTSVGRLIDTQTTKKEGRDVSRLKEVLVSMRHN